MTAEVAIVNKSAIALAADSLVTVTRGSSRKTYNANKLFTLSKHAPIGVMVFGDAALSGVPWETIIKVYRQDLGRTKFNSVQEYAEHFLAYLAGSDVLFSDQNQHSWTASLLHSFYEYVEKEIDKEAQKISDKGGGIADDEVKAVTERVIASELSEIDKQPMRDNISQDFFDKFLIEFDDDIEDAIKGYLGKRPLSEELRQRLRNIAPHLFMRESPLPMESGVVIAGFGERECFPKVLAYRLHGVCCKQLLYAVNEEESFTSEGCAVLPFAQRDVADSFLRGIDEHSLNILTRYMEKVLRDVVSQTIAEIVPGDEETKKRHLDKMTQVAKNALETLKTRFRDHLDEKHINPLLSTIAVIPKEELAVLAESLVSLTSQKRKISNEIETVGGPIDVAIISKGDGFVWIRRKYYFDPAINPSFVPRYLDYEGD